MSIAAQQQSPLTADETLKLKFWNAVIDLTNGFHPEKDHTLRFVLNETAHAIARSNIPLSREMITKISQEKYGKGEYSYSALAIPHLLGIHYKIIDDRAALRVA